MIGELLVAVLLGVAIFAVLQQLNPVTVNGAVLPSDDVLNDVSTLFNDTAGSLSSGDGVETLARTIWGEARGESDAGKIAVASVVRNRATAGLLSGWPSDIAGVCTQRLQFSCWNSNDPNRPLLLSVTEADPTYARCLEIAAGVVSGTIPDNTGGATCYYNPAVVTPSWAASMTVTARIGNHLFLR